MGFQDCQIWKIQTIEKMSLLVLRTYIAHARVTQINSRFLIVQHFSTGFWGSQPPAVHQQIIENHQLQIVTLITKMKCDKDHFK